MDMPCDNFEFLTKKKKNIFFIFPNSEIQRRLKIRISCNLSYILETKVS